MTNSQSHKPSPTPSAETVPVPTAVPAVPEVGDGTQASDLRFLPTVPAVPAPSPSTVPPSPSPPLYSGDRGRDQIRDDRRPWLWPFPDTFWRHPSTQAMYPEVWYAGPIPKTGDARTILEGAPGQAFVYVICDTSMLDVLYVGKTVDPVSRFANHRSRKEWWPDPGRLILLALHGEDRADAEAAALYIETRAIRKLRPLYNIAGVSR